MKITTLLGRAGYAHLPDVVVSGVVVVTVGVVTDVVDSVVPVVVVSGVVVVCVGVVTDVVDSVVAGHTKQGYISL